MTAYQPQVNTPAEDDPDNYMMLVPAAKKRPILQIVSATLAVILSVIGMGMDEMSDGDVIFSEPLKKEDFLEEVDYDCGWKSFRVNYWYYEDESQLGGKGNEHWATESYIFEYDGSFCQDYDTLVDKDFCTDSAYNGKIWLAFGIIGILCWGISIPIVWFQGKSSIIYTITLSIGILCMSIASLNWMFNDKCEDIERWPEEEATFDTTLGVSLVLTFIAIFFAIIGVLISSIHLMTPVRRRRQEEAIQAQQPR
eukprot:749525_1